MIKSSIFKSYDVRGIYPEQLNENTAYQTGRAFIKHTGAKKVVIGHDARNSSPELFRAIAEGILSEGSDVYSIGQVPTECVYFAVGYHPESANANSGSFFLIWATALRKFFDRTLSVCLKIFAAPRQQIKKEISQKHLPIQGGYDFDAGIMVTASHNPKEYNGFKTMVRKDNDIVWVRGKDLFSSLDQNGLREKPHGTIQEKDIWSDYINYVMRFSGEIKPFTIVVDASNGVIGSVISRIKDTLPVKITELNFEPNGNFPNHSPNPLEPGSSNQIKAEIQKQKADFGIMFDGDADRIFLVDEKGDLVSADIALLLLAKNLLLKNPGSAIAYNAICSKAVPEFITKWGGVPVRTAVGFVNVREGLIKNNGVMGGELSAHYCFKDYFYTDSGTIAFLTFLQVISQDGRRVSEMVKELSPYFKSAELNFEIDDKEGALKKVKEKYGDGKQDFLDGVTVEYNDWWCNVRPSNTEPLLRLTIEADTEDLLELKKQELRTLILEE